MCTQLLKESGVNRHLKPGTLPLIDWRVDGLEFEVPVEDKSDHGSPP